MKNIKVGDWVKLHKDLREGYPKESTEYQVKKVMEGGFLWILTPQFAQPWGYDGEQSHVDFVTNIREA